MLGLGKKLFSMYKAEASTAPAFGAPADPSSFLSSMADAVDGDNKWKLTNMGGIGSAEDLNLREKAAESEEAFAGAGTAPGLEVWRIEKFEPERVEARAGNMSLYSGDCYIILKTSLKEGSDALDWQLHYWIGKDCSQDEAGSASIFTVNIDDLLNQKPIQHREVQYSESPLFHSYFDSVTYLDGGIDSGFKKAEPEVYKPRLLQMTTIRSTVRVLQVPLAASSLNSGDVFVLDAGLIVYQFNAPDAAIMERRRAMEIVEQDIKAERDGEPELTILDGEEVFSCEPFWELLGGKIDTLPEPDSELDASDTAEVNYSGTKKLYKISDESGSLVMSLEKEDTSISESDINDDDIWVIACDGHCFITIGQNSNKDEKFHVWNACSSILLAAELDVTAPTMFITKDTDSETWANLFG